MLDIYNTTKQIHWKISHNVTNLTGFHIQTTLGFELFLCWYYTNLESIYNKKKTTEQAIVLANIRKKIKTQENLFLESKR